MAELPATGLMAPGGSGPDDWAGYQVFCQADDIMIKIDKTGVSILVMQTERNWDFRPHLSVKQFMMIMMSSAIHNKFEMNQIELLVL